MASAGHLATRDQIADTLARTYDGQPLGDMRDEHAALHVEAADAVLGALAADVEVSAYRIALLPVGHPMRAFAAITVRLCDSGLWQIDRLGFLLDADGRWEHPTRRSREWCAAREFDLETALRLARAAAPAIRVGDSTVGALIGREAS
ncbi:hypothetical protein G3I39_25265 [Streptomyces fulvissimus]|uniref:Uncharacterized protein n=1 Tax=Streptomyces microflavus TaxID=1919 RepID=A0A6N9VBU8_STRMI|nr:hypothetical protein [Streptomyces microflavus]NEB70340.1 hypothetical protein [Streptomyces microflavus]